MTDREILPTCTSFITNKFQRSNTPELCMEIEPSRVIFLGNEVGPLITIRRAEDDCRNPCIFRWSIGCDGWGPSGFMLFQHTADGLKEVEVKREAPSPETLKLTGHEVETEEILPGQTIQRTIDYPDTFVDQLVAGERYELFWPGNEYALWAWGTLREHLDQEIGISLGLPRAIIPGGACCSITFEKQREFTSSERDGPRVEKFQRIPGTPCMSVFLEGPSTISKAEGIRITAKITYDGLTNDGYEAVHADAKPIIIHDFPFGHDNFRLQRRCPNYNPLKNLKEDPPQWETYYDEERDANRGWIMVDDPDVEVNVTDSKWFRNLQPGETFTKSFHHDLSDLHPDTVAGNTCRFQYWGGCIDWWTWGDREEHANTVVKLPCWMNACVVDPVDNDGRPEIIIPSSNSLEFIVVD
ncbi:hypothetical protein N7494_010625 [Penicillium frequentans]|uniref:Uncharacterized protein n=1 Tax=Penicillium frequentans TaxID=3151616 RepID=A0AAD6CIF1_9EURO|nr:hypothetical protein N7494_010625 [Penicillium glabrum]